ncbi:MAG TPA: hypothetical protein PKC24_01650, partial [Cyclobacteriaceae bacterium]|nr:hypothetical protein [Cyclobacteriaceae bacterium]
LVDDMIVPHTGFGTSISAYYADGYEWILPTGWTDSQGNPGTRITSAPFINVKPTNGCDGGTVSVRGYIGGQSGTCSVRRFSSPATISVNRANLNVSIAFPSGYTGPSCGDTAGRTFTANTSYALNCLSSYRWDFPAGWKWYNSSTQTFVSSPVTISGSNSILLYPTGDVLDQGNITARVNLDCGSLPSVSRALTFQPPNPQVSGPEVICSNGSFTLTNAPVGSSITWQVSPSNFFTSSSGSGATANLQLQSSSVSGGAIITFNIQSTCDIPPIQTYFYAGKVAVPDIGINPFSPQDPLGPGYPYVCPNSTYSVFMWPTGSGFQYDIDLLNATYTQPDVNLPHFYWIHMDNYTPSSQFADASISARVNNGCGWSDFKHVLLYTEQDPVLCPSGGGCELCLLSISPNPTSDELSFEIDEEEWNTLVTRGADMNYQLILKNERGNDLIKLHTKQRKEKFDVSSLAEGTYYLVMKYRQTEEIRRVVIKR